ncbi:hypothetical protein D9757_006455 [Collybiopsis confluens]|uniref:Uncharacterized protein n=1 Tax=Collybiopsis confluens TaxID=2823264 RepID=A0A8H5M8G3_9AGAR|nr:hypothetical protein D9757_006455 [Collybiopsis confluens]
MHFFASSRPKDSQKRVSKKALGLGINILAASLYSNTAKPSPPSPHTFSANHTGICSSSSNTITTAKSKPAKTRPRSSTTVATRNKPALKARSHHDEISGAGDLPVLTALRARPAYYEDLHTISAFGELPIPIQPSLPIEDNDVGSFAAVTSPISPPARLFEVAKPPASARRRRYTVATSQPSLVGPLQDNSQVEASTGLAELKEEPNTVDNDEGLPSPHSRPPALRAYSAPCETLYSPTFPDSSSTLSENREALTPTNSGITTPTDSSFSSSELPSTPKSPTVSSPRGTHVNLRFVKHYPYMLPELPKSPLDDETSKDGVLSRVKYRLVKKE